MVVIAIHGGAGGDGPRRAASPHDEARLAVLQALLDSIGPRLAAGELSALEAVTQAVEWMEDEPLYNAGRGSVLDRDGAISMEASVMVDTLHAGAVLGARTTRHPVRLASRVLERSRDDGGAPLVLSGPGVDELARQWALEQQPPTWFITEQRAEQWERWRAAAGATMLDHEAEQAHSGAASGPSEVSHAHGQPVETGADTDAHGTVGAVALDADGHLAAATSTGGMTGRDPARHGDSGIIGAGTWCDAHAAVSCTGNGEAFVRRGAAQRFAALVELGGLSAAEAAARMMATDLPAVDARGGLIAVTRTGEAVLPYDTAIMYRGTWRPDEGTWVAH